MERSKVVPTEKELVTIRKMLSNNDIIEACKKRADAKWKFEKLAVVTVLPAQLRNVPDGFKDAQLTEPSTRSHFQLSNLRTEY